ncbi:MAG: methionine synthase [Bacteroidales bacterium]|nr:methionine synthase [Bacteroidales bacterium]
MAQSYGLGAEAYVLDGHTAAGCHDVLCLTRPDIVADIHRQYLEAGADIITTNSFSSNQISLADYDLQHRAADLSTAAARIAREQADKYSTPERPRYVAGSLGPTNRCLSMSPDVNRPGYREITFEQMHQAYSEQARALIEAGVDMIIIETVFDTLNAKAALKAIREISQTIPVIVSGTLSDASGRTLSGQTVEAFCTSVTHARPYAVSLNCGYGARHLLPYLRRLAAVCPTRVAVYPNAGLPNIEGRYDETPEMFAADMAKYLAEGLVYIVGGCCGTTPEHIAALAKAVEASGKKSRLSLLIERYKRGEYQPDQLTHLAGLEPLSIGENFTDVGERTNVAGSAKFARLIREGKYDEALDVAHAQVAAGAQVIDVCMDDAMIPGPEAMTQFLNLIAAEPDIARVPVMVDSSNWATIEAGLQCLQGKGIVNSISLKEGEERFLEHARTIMLYGAAAVVMLFDERGQADTYERKIEVARRAYDLLVGIGFNPNDIIIDPNVLAVATGMPEHDRYARDFIDATRWIKQNLPGAKVSGGVSNLSFSFRGNNDVRKAMHAVFLYHAIQAGMDMAIVNPQMVQLYTDIPADLLQVVEDVILYRSPDASEHLIEFAAKMQQPTSQQPPSPLKGEQLSVGERIAQAMLRGDTSTIAADALEAMPQCGSAIAVISDLLMPAMERVGQLFGEGKMFLPQVVKSARVMKQAVDALTPYIQAPSSSSRPLVTIDPIAADRVADAGESMTIDSIPSASTASAATSGHERPRLDSSGHDKNAPRVVFATVKGDVHDIGKNIVSVVLACNGVEVTDLGVMVEPDTIINKAREIGADAIGLSGLITPSLTEMIRVAEEGMRQGVDVPIIIGGATTTPLHTAVKIATATTAPVIHARDAADTARIVSALRSENREQLITENARKQAEIREKYEREQAPQPPKGVESAPQPPKGGDAVEEIASQYRHKAGCGCPCCTGAMAKQDGEPSMATIRGNINWAFFFAAWGVPGKLPDIFDHPTRGEEARKLYDDAQRMLDRIINEGLIEMRSVIETFPARAEGDDVVLTLPDGQERRLAMLRQEDGDRLSVADFVDGEATLFAICGGFGVEELCKQYRAEGDEYNALMVKFLADRLTEAYAETMLEGCRIAFGYPSAPDHTLKRDVFEILDVEAKTGMRLTESCMIVPGEAICGIYLPKGHYFSVGRPSDTQLASYAQRRSLPLEIIKAQFAF